MQVAEFHEMFNVYIFTWVHRTPNNKGLTYFLTPSIIFPNNNNEIILGIFIFQIDILKIRNFCVLSSLSESDIKILDNASRIM